MAKNDDDAKNDGQKKNNNKKKKKDKNKELKRKLWKWFLCKVQFMFTRKGSTFKLQHYFGFSFSHLEIHCKEYNPIIIIIIHFRSFSFMNLIMDLV